MVKSQAYRDAEKRVKDYKEVALGLENPDKQVWTRALKRYSNMSADDQMSVERWQSLLRKR